MTTQRLRYGQIQLELYADKIAWHADSNTLFCSDLHWGKETTFQRASLPIPTQLLDSNLQKINLLIEHLRPERIVVLGDMVHGMSSFSDTFRATMCRFWDSQRRRSNCEWILVEGNHDHRAKSELKNWPVRMVSPPWQFEDFICVHDPLENLCSAESQPGLLFLAGHLHPAYRMPDNGERLACFALRKNVLIFPAFSDFTGRKLIDTERAEVVFLIRHGEIVRFCPPR